MPVRNVVLCWLLFRETGLWLAGNEKSDFLCKYSLGECTRYGAGLCEGLRGPDFSLPAQGQHHSSRCLGCTGKLQQLAVLTAWESTRCLLLSSAIKCVLWLCMCFFQIVLSTWDNVKWRWLPPLEQLTIHLPLLNHLVGSETSSAHFSQNQSLKWDASLPQNLGLCTSTSFCENTSPNSSFTDQPPVCYWVTSDLSWLAYCWCF